jgi:hypothetical protein
MAGHVIGEAVRRAKVEPGEVEDVVMGCAMQQGTTAMNVARTSYARRARSAATTLRLSTLAQCIHEIDDFRWRPVLLRCSFLLRWSRLLLWLWAALVVRWPASPA